MAELVRRSPRGLVVAGPMADPTARRAVADLADSLGWPLLPDVTSGLRLDSRPRTAVPSHELLLSSETFMQRHHVQAVAHVGGRMTSKRLLDRLSAPGRGVPPSAPAPGRVRSAPLVHCRLPHRRRGGAGISPGAGVGGRDPESGPRPHRQASFALQRAVLHRLDAVRISDCRLFRYRLPLAEPLTLAGRVIHEREGVLIRVDSDSGASGWGDVAPLPAFSRESIEDAEAEIASLAKRLRGAEFDDRTAERGSHRRLRYRRPCGSVRKRRSRACRKDARWRPVRVWHTLTAQYQSADCGWVPGSRSCGRPGTSVAPVAAPSSSRWDSGRCRTTSSSRGRCTGCSATTSA